MAETTTTTKKRTLTSAQRLKICHWLHKHHETLNGKTSKAVRNGILEELGIEVTHDQVRQLARDVSEVYSVTLELTVQQPNHPTLQLNAKVEAFAERLADLEERYDRAQALCAQVRRLTDELEEATGKVKTLEGTVGGLLRRIGELENSRDAVLESMHGFDGRLDQHAASITEVTSVLRDVTSVLHETSPKVLNRVAPYLRNGGLGG